MNETGPRANPELKDFVVCTRARLAQHGFAARGEFLAEWHYTDGTVYRLFATSIRALAELVGTTPLDRIVLFRHADEDPRSIMLALQAELNAQRAPEKAVH